MPKANIASEIVEGLNAELGGLRDLHAKQDVALDPLKYAIEGIKDDFHTGLTDGAVPVHEVTRKDELIALAANIPEALALAAKYGKESQEFVDRLQRLITTKKNGKSIVGSINPLFVNHDFEPERNYKGDKPGLTRLYVVSKDTSGRVVDTHFRYKKSRHDTGMADVTDIDIWVWPNDVKKWDGSSGHNSGQRLLSLLDKDVVFVDYVEGCELPAPGKYARRQLIPD